MEVRVRKVAPRPVFLIGCVGMVLAALWLAGSVSSGTLRSCKGIKVAYAAVARLPVMQETYVGAKQAAAECGGASVALVGPPGFDVVAQIKAMRDAIAAGAKGVMLEPLPPQAWANVINQTVRQGTPMYSEDVPAPNTLVSVHVGPGPYEMGAGMARVIAALAGKGAKGLIVIGEPSLGVQLQEARITSFKRVMKQLEPSVTFTPTQVTTTDPATDYTTWKALAQKYSNALALVDFAEFSGPNLARIKQETKAKWLDGSIGSGIPSIQGVVSGFLDVSIGQRAWEKGYITMRLLLLHLMNGKAVVPRGWIDSGVDVITKSNAAAILARETAGQHGNSTPSVNWYKSFNAGLFKDPGAKVRPLSDIFSTNS
jgi:ABC-type sugar transport system substrate-binding protein